MAATIALAAQAPEVAEGEKLDGGGATEPSNLHKENALENWEKVKALMENKKVCCDDSRNYET